MNTRIRTRIAPSPTGALHFGTVRTALFNYLWAKKHGGDFIVRIEDTDRARSTEESEKDIIEHLRWIGLTWDEGVDIGGPFGPYRQMERLLTYEKYTKELLEGGKAYYCYCSPEELEAERTAQEAMKLPPKYSGKCRNLADRDRDRYANEGRAPVVRFRVPEQGAVVMEDIVRGTVTFDNALHGDIVIVKSDGIPVYNYAVVIDDAMMQISHVIRGEEHLANTPKQILLIEALGFERPVYAHLPLILNPDRTKMSKRSGPTRISEYKERGFLPAALLNFMVLLGWNDGTEKEFYSLDEMVRAFDLSRIGKSGGVFDIDRLHFINAHYLKTMTPDAYIAAARPFLQSLPGNHDVDKLALIVRDRTRFLAELPDLAAPFVSKIDYPGGDLIWKKSTKEETVSALTMASAVIGQIEEHIWNDIASLEAFLHPYPLEHNIKPGVFFWPLRIALSGLRESPGVFELMWFLGKEESLKRIEIAINKAKNIEIVDN